MTPLFERMLVAGVGLIGGSLALAARTAGLVGEVVGFGRGAANLEVARANGVVDHITQDVATAVAGADLIVLAAPVGACAQLAATFRPHAQPGTLLTDVGSVKGSLVAALEAVWQGVGPVVGTHPIAGSETSGAAAARADLFQDRLCIITPTDATEAGAKARIRTLWEGVGARLEEMSPVVHDDILARVSHLPHLIAYALVTAADRTAGERRVLDYAGAGFADTTRIAASPAVLWRDIALANAGALGPALRDFRTALDRLERLLAAGDGPGLEAALAEAQRARRALGGR